MLIKIQPDNLLRRTIKSGTREFIHAGEQDRFEQDKDDPRMDPMYLDGSFSYSFNSLGYRTAEIETFSPDNFVLVFGCSYTEGVALHEEHIWHSHLRSDFDIPIMNLGLGGTGGEIIRFNSVQYVANKLPRPKLVIFQWPGDHRKLFAGNSVNTLDPHTPSLEIIPGESAHGDPTGLAWRVFDEEWYRKRYVPYIYECQQTVYQNYMIANTVFNAIGVPTFNWQYAEDRLDNTMNPLLDGKQPNLVRVTGETSPKARDLMHPGKECQLDTYKQIQKKVAKLL